MKASSFLFGFIALTGSCWARLGEKEHELVARFGQPVMRGKQSHSAQGKMWELGPRLYFKQDDWNIVSVLIDGRVAHEEYGKVGSWTAEQVQAVLSANAQGAKWTETTKSGATLSRNWKRADGAVAEWVQGGGFTFTTPAFGRAKELAEAKAKAAAKHTPKI
jgi:hypothetical protein